MIITPLLFLFSKIWKHVTIWLLSSLNINDCTSRLDPKPPHSLLSAHNPIMFGLQAHLLFISAMPVKRRRLRSTALLFPRSLSISSSSTSRHVFSTIYHLCWIFSLGCCLYWQVKLLTCKWVGSKIVKAPLNVCWLGGSHAGYEIGHKDFGSAGFLLLQRAHL